MKTQNGSTPTISHYDPHIIPTETAVREAREGKHFGHVDHDDSADTEHLHTRDGYTIDQEGLINNYAIESEPYIKEPGDLKAQELKDKAERLRVLQELSEDEQGKLTMDHDWRHKGPGLI